MRYLAGELIKVGGGSLVLSGVNTQQSGTRLKEGSPRDFKRESVGHHLTMDGGTLNLSGTTALTQPVNFPSASTVSVETGGNVEFRGLLSGSGDFAKSGSGTLQISGSGALYGGVSLQAGTLKVTRRDVVECGDVGGWKFSGGSKATILDVSGLASGLELGSEQSLKGRGVLLGKVSLNGGQLKPGNSIDVLHIRWGSDADQRGV